MDFVAKIVSEIDNDMRTTIRKLATGQGVSIQTIQKTKHKNLDLTKKSARWVPKLVSSDLRGVFGHGSPPLNDTAALHHDHG